MSRQSHNVISFNWSNYILRVFTVTTLQHHLFAPFQLTIHVGLTREGQFRAVEVNFVVTTMSHCNNLLDKKNVQNFHVSEISQI